MPGRRDDRNAALPRCRRDRGVAGHRRDGACATAGSTVHQPRAVPAGAAVALALAVVAGYAIALLPESAVLPLGLPDLPFHLRIDALSAFFLLLLGAASAAISLFSSGYFRSSEGTAPGLICFQYHAFLAAMALVLVADDAYVFMVAWETMALASFFLVTTEHRIPEIRRAGFLYLLIAHVGAIAILLCFRRAPGRNRRLHVRLDAVPHVDGTMAHRRLLSRAGGLRRKSRSPAAAHLAAGGAPGRPVAGLGADERRDAEDGDLRLAARGVRPAARPALVVGRGRAGAGARDRAVRRRFRRGAIGHEAAARVFVDREHRDHRRRHRARHSVQGVRQDPARRGDADGGALPLPQPCVLQEPAVPRRPARCCTRRRRGASAGSAA